MKIETSHVILDACCILNFSASGNLLGILEAIPARVAVSLVVKRDELKTLPGPEKELEAAIALKSLVVVDFESEEEEATYINYAVALDDGESATGAIAFHRGWAIGTDDKRAKSFFSRDAPDIQIISTLEMVKHWSETAEIDPPALRDVLRAIRVQGRYMPRQNHPLRDWWETRIQPPP
ncbi:MAG: hypothetical protein SXA11_12090 [Cyanobacteriota bacterium]|nr:hypothetical protein [Cyanobacteriota bacterium]